MWAMDNLFPVLENLTERQAAFTSTRIEHVSNQQSNENKPQMSGKIATYFVFLILVTKIM